MNQPRKKNIIGERLILQTIGLTIAMLATNGCMTSRMLNADALARRHPREIKQAWRSGDAIYLDYEAYHYIHGKVWGTEEKHAQVEIRVKQDNSRLFARFIPIEQVPYNFGLTQPITVRHLTNAVSQEMVLDGNLIALNHQVCTDHFLLLMRPSGDTNRILKADIQIPTGQWKSVVKTIATPFTVATDIVLSPVYALFGVWWYCQWRQGADW